MDNKVKRLIVSNKNEKAKGDSRVYIHLKHFIEDNKKYFYLELISSAWHEGFFIPLSHVKEDGRVSSLNMLPLHHDKLGFNLEEIWRNQGISLYKFLNDNEEKNQLKRKEDFALAVSKFMYVFLDIPFEKMMQLLNWIYNSNYAYFNSKPLLLLTFELESEY